MSLRALGLWLAAALPAAAEPTAIRVEAAAETEGMRGDADDPAIWADGADSLILGTDKEAGLHVYGLDGAQRAFLPDGRLNNVDVRRVVVGGRELGLAGATRRDDETLVFYLIEAGTVRRAVPWQHAAIPPGVPADDIYGFAMGLWEGRPLAIVNFKSGHVVLWRVHEAQGTIGLTPGRVVALGSQPEGMVADDRAGHLYVGEEDRGIWRLPLDPASEEAPRLVVPIPSPCLPRDDVEGLAIHDGADGVRRLVASAQGIHRAALFRLEGEADPVCEALVEVAPGAVDGVTETDGLDVWTGPLPGFPEGLLVMMDDQNAGFTTNFKLIDWAAVAAGLP
ncbi:phytase [Rubellimicrobium sp. CFH 75288]|uniref:phytase n=1 Tax=Rubellimicrobium sp. CFH 75288 TaxID=2697034 RepID=UPI0014136EFF|nr:phytase [Rubellimicrobium sp. CFH 75288]NAZ38074.1 phytase [Rubellimicrobium sp. CFH 75288]